MNETVFSGLRKGVFLAWNSGCVRYFDGFKLRDMGAMQCEAQAEEWCRVHRVRFMNELPERWEGFGIHYGRGGFARRAGRKSKCV